MSNQFKLGADAAVAAGPVVTHRPPPTCSFGRRFELLTCARAFCRCDDQRHGPAGSRCERFYGKRLETKQIVFGPSLEGPEPVTVWLQALDRYSR